MENWVIFTRVKELVEKCVPSVPLFHLTKKVPEKAKMECEGIQDITIIILEIESA